MRLIILVSLPIYFLGFQVMRGNLVNGVDIAFLMWVSFMLFWKEIKEWIRE
jgi:hypothetical protein